MMGLYRRSFSCNFVREVLDVDFSIEFRRELLNSIAHSWSAEEVRDFVADDIIFGRHIENEFVEACRILLRKPTRTVRDERVLEIIVKNALQIQTFHIEVILMAKRGESGSMIKLLSYIDNINYFISYSGLPGRTIKYAPIHVAAAFGLPSVIDYLVKRGADVNKLMPDNGFNALHFISIWNIPQDAAGTIEILVQNGIDLEFREYTQGLTPLLFAVLYGRKELVDILLRYNANIHAVDAHHQMAMHLVFITPGNLKLELCEMLLKKNLNSNVQTMFGNTPLHYIAMSKFLTNKAEVVNCLLKYSADLNIQSDVGDTALTIAARICPDDLEFIIFLLDKGANTGIANYSNETFLDFLKVKRRDNGLKILRFLCFENICERFQFPQVLTQSIISDEEFSAYWRSCRRELQFLEASEIHPDAIFKYLAFLNSDLRHRALMCRNEDIRNAMSNFDEDNFPIYGQDLMIKFNEGLSLYEKQNSCMKFLTDCFGDILDFYAISDTIDEISIEDIQTAEENLRFLSNDLIEQETDSEEDVAATVNDEVCGD